MIMIKNGRHQDPFIKDDPDPVRIMVRSIISI